MEIKIHPTSEKSFMRQSLGSIAFFFVVMVAPLILSEFDFSGRLLDRIGLAYVCGIFLLFICAYVRQFSRLYHQACPQCGGTTVTRSGCPELPGTWSTRCDRCNVLWDLGIGNRD